MFEYGVYHSCIVDDDNKEFFEMGHAGINQPVLNAMAIDAYIYGYPLVLMEITKQVSLNDKLCMNQFINQRSFPNSQFTTVVRANVDTLYSMAWLELSAEPIVLSIPEIQSRYYLMQFLDAWTNVFTSVGTRTTGTGAGAFAITGPNWNGVLPKGIIRIEAPTNTVWLIGRIQTNGTNDYPLVNSIQDKLCLTPLSRWENGTSYDKNEADANPQSVNPVERVAAMDAATFFQIMMRLMYVNPSWIEDPRMNKTLSRLALQPGNFFDFFNLPPVIRQALENAVIYGQKLLTNKAKDNHSKNNSNGWDIKLKNIGFYGVDYLQRGVIALTGIGANLPQDAIYGSATVDASGTPLAGCNNYMIHFEKEQLPPVNAFWSITAYDDKGYLISNPINRSAVSPHLNSLTYNSDGSLDIFIGDTSPKEPYTSNWLPTANDSFNLTLRMYWPGQTVLGGQWIPPAIQQSIST